MELTLCPRRARYHPALVLAFAVLAGWVAAVVLLPPVLGLHTSLALGPSAEYSDGTLVVTRTVPSSDVAPDDVLVADGVHRRVLATEAGLIRVAGAEPILTSASPMLDRVVTTLPMVGVPLAGTNGPWRWLMAGGFAAIAAAVSLRARTLPTPAARRWRLAA